MYNLTLAQRIHDLIGDQPGLQEKKMFGGVGYILSGNMACGILNDDLIVRLGTDLDSGSRLRRQGSGP